MRKKVALFGCGRLGSVIADAIYQNKVSGAELDCIFCRNSEKAEELRAKYNCTVVTDMQAFLAAHPDIIIEAVTPDALREIGPELVSGGADLIVLNTGVFVDEAFKTQMEKAANEHGSHIYLASGVVGGFDIIRTAALMGGAQVKFSNRAPKGIKTPLSEYLKDGFEGNAVDAYHRFYKHMNVIGAVAFASGDPENTTASIGEGDPPGFEVEVVGPFGKARIHTMLGKAGLAMAAWSVIAVLDRITSTISF